jgi:hypothetical protein
MHKLRWEIIKNSNRMDISIQQLVILQTFAPIKNNRRLEDLHNIQ